MGQETKGTRKESIQYRSVERGKGGKEKMDVPPVWITVILYTVKSHDLCNICHLGHMKVTRQIAVICL